MIRFRRSQTVYRRRYEFARFDVNRGFIHTAAVQIKRELIEFTPFCVNRDVFVYGNFSGLFTGKIGV